MALFLMSFWDSSSGQEALVLVAVQIIGFFAFNPVAFLAKSVYPGLLKLALQGSYQASKYLLTY
eukprot:scaffold18646_cov65-Phaeocystis_antarctica.AAC.2